MAVFVSDTFTDTDTTILQSHTGETGATWTEHPNELGNDATIVSNQCTHTAANAVGYYASGVPSSNEYDIEYTVHSAASSTYGCGGSGRLLTTALTGYLAFPNATKIIMYKMTAGSFANIGEFTVTVVAGDAIKLEIRSAAKKIYLNAVEKVSSADDTHTGAGRAGVRFYGNGGILDNFVATDLSGGGGFQAAWARNANQSLRGGSWL